MKRLLAVVAFIALLFTPALADTITIDIETAALEELIALRDQLNERILLLEGAKQLKLAQGTYTAGMDIAAGVYEVVCADNVESAFVYIYAPESERWYNYEHFYALGSFHACMKIGKLQLNAGARIDIQGANLTFIPYTGE